MPVEDVEDQCKIALSIRVIGPQRHCASHELLGIFDKDATTSLWPFVQYERLNTQDEVPAGFSKNAATDRKAWTFGAAFYPDPQIVIKADYRDGSTPNGSSVDRFAMSMGYLF